MQALKKMELAPWIQKATALIGNNRNVGGNQFRHCMAAMIILLDYHFIDSVMLKASITHDLLEDSDKVKPEEFLQIDNDGPAVLKLVNELTHNKLTETKEEYFDRLINKSSPEAKIVKLADRISNLTTASVTSPTCTFSSSPRKKRNIFLPRQKSSSTLSLKSC